MKDLENKVEVQEYFKMEIQLLDVGLAEKVIMHLLILGHQMKQLKDSFFSKSRWKANIWNVEDLKMQLESSHYKVSFYAEIQILILTIHHLQWIKSQLQHLLFSKHSSKVSWWNQRSFRTYNIIKDW